MRYLLILAGLLVVACSDGTAPSLRPEPWPYVYTYHSPRPGGGPDLAYQGHLILSGVTDEEVTGQWVVQGYESEVGLGFWNVDAYVLYATATGTGWTIRHRVSGSGVTLSVECGVVYFNNGLTSIDGTCTLIKQ